MPTNHRRGARPRRRDPGREFTAAFASGRSFDGLAALVASDPLRPGRWIHYAMRDPEFAEAWLRQKAIRAKVRNGMSLPEVIAIYRELEPPHALAVARFKELMGGSIA